jgi:hypothetical protein
MEQKYLTPRSSLRAPCYGFADDRRPGILVQAGMRLVAEF